MSKIISLISVISSADIARDVLWYQNKVGFKSVYADEMYAVLHRDGISIHLQWHAGTVEDPLLGGSVVRILVDSITLIFEEMIKRGAVSEDKLQLNTPWNTNEFGFYDLNNNAIIITEDLM